MQHQPENDETFPLGSGRETMPRLPSGGLISSAPGVSGVIQLQDQHHGTHGNQYNSPGRARKKQRQQSGPYQNPPSRPLSSSEQHKMQAVTHGCVCHDDGCLLKGKLIDLNISQFYV